MCLATDNGIDRVHVLGDAEPQRQLLLQLLHVSPHPPPTRLKLTKPSYFLQQAGLPTDTSYAFALGQYAINMVGVLGAWFLMTLGIGRRTLYLYGLVLLCTMLFILGFLGLVPEEHRAQGSLATGSIMLVWALCYQLSVGTVCYSLVGELSARRLQIKTVVLGRNL